MNEKYLSLEERELIEKYIKEKFTGNQIAFLLKRSQNCINREIKINGGRVFYNASQASVNSRMLKRKKNKNLLGEKLKDRIESLEMQMEILTDEIKKVRNDTKN